ncbi:tRNA pseudouridine(13) synthase TruD [Pseudoxanthomonas composti]|uniref:tRNA pseudouridine synthase D n=1 Tax=Pseudoxanthomonas composti TaxID=2137479 RepID=A0A4Q1JUF8_9GAMM|nr:tRNA pseudouridine(13) synthase TruD [Pseudoxanthomonas composti]RXR05340.1 tRNA pseudouridine(13) synthase TruD [Pseudoxanthomonas composti]
MSGSALPNAFGTPVLESVMRATPEDFRVDELDGFQAHGEGEHLLLTIEKRGLNTTDVARRLARWAGIGEVGIGYAGMKDRHAVTTQRFSVHLPKRVAPALEALQESASGEGTLKVVHQHWHNRKLPRGALAGNRFTLTLRQVRGEREAIAARLQQIAQRGIPNWFGEQRFGRGGGNVAQALAMFAGRRVKREQRSMLLSAARSQLFNQVLTRRVEAGCWDQPMEGEVWMLAGSRSVFGPEAWSEALAERLASFDIHPSGPLWGEGELRSAHACAALELDAVSDAASLKLRQGLEQAELKQERRALRLRPEQFAWQWLAEDVLELRFALPPGAYATAVLHELGQVGEAGRDERGEAQADAR